MKRLILAITVLLVVLILSSCARFSYVEHRRGYKHLMQPYVRVKILEVNELTLESSGPFELYCMLPDGSTTDYFSNSDLLIRAEGSHISVRQKSGLPLESKLNRVVAVPSKADFHLTLNGSRFRGIADVIVENGGISVVNAIYMEDYLKGVLPPEIGRHGRPELEALKAQAVASRTYALSRFRQNPAEPYDMVNEVADQIYIGMSSEDRWINEAIEATRGEVLLADDELITAYYHSTCGGSTDNIEDVWDRQPKSYLKSHDDDSFCEWSKYSEWSFTWSRSQLEESISKYLKQKGRLKQESFDLANLEVIDRLPSGRIRVLKVSAGGEEFLIFKDQIRWAFLRPDREDAILPSTNFHLEIDRDSSDGSIVRITATGRGNGHGVGMCQCGALGRSRAGKRYRDILGAYYQGAKVTEVY
jgi:stage II sporulation protein D